MKYLYTALAVLCIPILAMARDPESVTVGTTSTMILPPVQPDTYTTWATGTAYTAEAIVESGGRFYWCVTAGTSTNVATGGPSHTDGDGTEGTVTWRYVHPSRDVVTLYNTNGVDIAIGYEDAAEAGKGEVVKASGGVLVKGDGRLRACQDAIYAIVDSGTNSLPLRVQEE